MFGKGRFDPLAMIGQLNGDLDPRTVAFLRSVPQFTPSASWEGRGFSDQPVGPPPGSDASMRAPTADLGTPPPVRGGGLMGTGNRRDAALAAGAPLTDDATAPGGQPPTNPGGLGKIVHKLEHWATTPGDNGMSGLGTLLNVAGAMLTGTDIHRLREQARADRGVQAYFQNFQDANGRAPTLKEALPDLLPAIVSGNARALHAANLLGQLEPGAPRIIEGPDGIYSVPEGGTPSRIMAYPEKRSAPSPGWRLAADGVSWEPIPNGPYDPAYIAKTSGVRRDAIVKRPMPQKPRAAHPGYSGLPPGYQPK
jgi:hypothetical protein